MYASTGCLARLPLMISIATNRRLPVGSLGSTPPGFDVPIIANIRRQRVGISSIRETYVSIVLTTEKRLEAVSLPLSRAR